MYKRLAKRIQKRIPQLAIRTSSSKFYRHTGIITLLAFFVVISNIKELKAKESGFIEQSSTQTSAIVSALSPYTSALEEDPVALALAVDGVEEGFLAKPNLEEAIMSPVVYTVKEGDTVSSIANKYSVSVATILEENNLKPADLSSVLPGTELTIPPFSTNESTAWLDEVNKINAEKARKAEEERQKNLAAQAKKKRLALQDKRSLSYRESSTTRETADADFEGTSGGFIVPINHNGITRGISRGHTGIDYRADTGTPVSAGEAGKVVEITGGWSGGWGVSVVLDHGGGLTSRYAHLSKAAVSIGQTVSQGSIVGYSGNSGFSTGPHLHFETRINGRVVSPF